MDLDSAERAIEVDPDLAELLSRNPSTPPPRDIPSLRAQLAPIELTLWGSIPPNDVDEHTQMIGVGNGVTIPVLIHRPKSSSSISPLIVYYHAGGFCVGSSTLAMPFCRILVQRFNAVVVNVDYRLAPEHPFPTPISDSWHALQWAASHAARLGADPTHGFIIAGESSGGNIAAVLAHLARDSGISPPLTGQVLSVPSCLPPGTVPARYTHLYHSWQQALKEGASPLFNLEMIMMLRHGHNANPLSPLFAAFNDRHGHAELPPAYFQVCGIDPVRDEGLLYEKVLREEHGVRTKLDFYEGLPHSFWQLYPGLPKSEQAREDMFKGFDWLLAQTR